MLAADDTPVALDLDGSYFAALPADGGRERYIDFPYAPSGGRTLDLLPRCGRAGAALAAAPARLQIGRSGASAAPQGRPVELAPLRDEAALVPFGTDVASGEVAVIVPVYNAPELAARCLDSVLAQRDARTRLIVVDDASPDPAIAPLLAGYAGIERVALLRNERNLGFTATVNRGLAEARDADVLLLNADAEVGPGWLPGLRRAAYSRADVGTVTAVSDNAGAFSVPELEAANPLPAGWSFGDAARALWQQAGLAYPELPTGNGFCLYVRRAVLEVIGGFDAWAFPRGYGEENDFCRRAARHGFRHLVVGNVLVRHARSASFGAAEREVLGSAGMEVLRRRWPDYEQQVGEQLFSYARRVLDWRVRRIYAQAAAGCRPRPRLLWVGAQAPVWSDAEIWTLVANGSENELLREDALMAANTWLEHDPEPSYRALWDWLQLYAFEGLLVREGGNSATEILCRLLGVPVWPVDSKAASARVALPPAAATALFGA